ncbi:hypothetical protein MLD38_006468 [Melastoma candidum]|uniref:Uncharacterized protein n=1 Tax=Melastoma candidum TaxID=119954 RepID=A0ACB9RNI4_9MYRT|nr:hypothetical protein MLD38_006468 [Melastoma candidum]
MVVVTGLELATGGFLAIGYLFGIGVGQVLHCLSSQGKAGEDRRLVVRPKGSLFSSPDGIIGSDKVPINGLKPADVVVSGRDEVDLDLPTDDAGLPKDYFAPPKKSFTLEA